MKPPKMYLVTAKTYDLCYRQIEPFLTEATKLGLSCKTVPHANYVVVEGVIFYLVPANDKLLCRRVRGATFDRWIRGEDDLDPATVAIIESRIRSERREAS